MKWTHRQLDQETEHNYYFKTLLLWSSRHSNEKKNLLLLLTWHIFACFWSVNIITFYAVFYMKFLYLIILTVSSTFMKSLVHIYCCIAFSSKNIHNLYITLQIQYFCWLLKYYKFVFSANLGEEIVGYKN